MNADALILVLEDERSQVMLLRSQIGDLGRLAEYSDPEKALEYARKHACDAAIVDVNLRRASMNGLEFLRQLRGFDRQISAIIRTGSVSDAIADQALELRAMRRIVKTRSTLSDIRRCVREAVQETRDSRRTAERARSAEVTKASLDEALGSQDLRLASAEMNRGLLHALRNRLTALSAMAAVMEGDAKASGQAEFIENARRCTRLVADTVDSINLFLDGPFGEGGRAGRAAVNICLAALRQYFAGSDVWTSQGKGIAVRTLSEDARVACVPLALTNALRHMAEFYLARAEAGQEIVLSASLIAQGRAAPPKGDPRVSALNAEALRGGAPMVAFRICARVGESSPEAVRDALTFGGEAARSGNLSVLGQVLSSCGGAAVVEEAGTGALALTAYFPVSL